MGEECARPRDENGPPPEESEPKPPEDLDDGDWVEDISDTVAPSIGPHSYIVHHAHEHERASRMDAMGLDKRRAVVGESYGPSFGKQARLYGGALAIVAVLVIGFVLLAKELDKSPETFPDEAPWATVPEATENKAVNPSRIDLQRP
jgi:hypothetical protein